MENRLSVTKKQLQKELEAAQKQLKRGYAKDSWLGHEPMGRVLRYMKDPTAHEHLEKALSDYMYPRLQGHQESTAFIKIGNYNRLLGNHEEAQRYFEKGYALAKQQTGELTDDPASLNYDTMQELIFACFLLGKDEEAIAYGRLFHEDDPNPEWKAYLIAQLAAARLNRDAALAEEVIKSLVRLIKKSRAKIQTDGIVTLWDTYELALETLANIEQAGSVQAEHANDGPILPQGLYLPAKLRENIERKARLTVDPQQLQEELAYANRCLKDGFTVEGHELLGRVLRRMGDPTAQEHLSKAIENLRGVVEALDKRRNHATVIAHLGQLYHLLDDQKRAQEYFAQAYAQARKEVGNRDTGEIDLTDPGALNYDWASVLVLAALLSGHDNEALDYGRFFHEYGEDGKLICYHVALLAEAKLTNDVTKAEEVAQINLYLIEEDEDEWSIVIADYKDPGAVLTELDLYELALQTIAEIEKNQ